VLLWLTDGELTLPFEFSTFTLSIGEPAYLGADLQDAADLTLSRSAQAAFRRFTVERALYGAPMNCHPIFEGRFSWANRDFDFCFVLMPFTEDWSDRIWRRHLQPAITRAGFRCARADDFFGPGAIVEDLWAKINAAGVVIADLTGRNPNVFYELGIAHTVGTPAILVSQDHEIPAFDSAHLRQIRYADNSDGCDALEHGVEAALQFVKERMRWPRT
jgi:hypothetical protein